TPRAGPDPPLRDDRVTGRQRRRLFADSPGQQQHAAPRLHDPAGAAVVARSREPQPPDRRRQGREPDAGRNVPAEPAPRRRRRGTDLLPPPVQPRERRLVVRRRRERRPEPWVGPHEGVDLPDLGSAEPPLQVVVDQPLVSLVGHDFPPVIFRSMQSRSSRRMPSRSAANNSLSSALRCTPKASMGCLIV
ncbi:MAG: hypothetical protein ACK559_20785, partial [bacterium]